MPKTYKLEFSKSAIKDLSKLDKASLKRIKAFLLNNVHGTDNPRRLGKTLKGKHNGLWRYRVGKYRIVCQIKDRELEVLAVKAT